MVELASTNTILQTILEEEKRGRVMALWAMTLSASAPLGHLLAGQTIAALNDVGPVLFGMAAGIAVATLALATILTVRGLK